MKTTLRFRLLVSVAMIMTARIHPAAAQDTVMEDVVYLKNGALYYTSRLEVVYPLLVDTSLSSLGATLKDVTIKGR